MLKLEAFTLDYDAFLRSFTTTLALNTIAGGYSRNL